MQSAMATLEQQFAEAGLSDLHMRIGIHQGPAVVGNFGSNQRSDYTAIGPTVNFASRIESACTPGKVFVSETIRAFVHNARTVEAGNFELKGMDTPQALFSLHPGSQADKTF